MRVSRPGGGAASDMLGEAPSGLVIDEDLER